MYFKSIIVVYILLGDGRRSVKDSSPSRPVNEKPMESHQDQDELDLFGDMDKPLTSQATKPHPVQQDSAIPSVAPTSVASTTPTTSSMYIVTSY